MTTFTCKICGEEFTSPKSGKLKSHIINCHNLVWEDYLREYHPELGGYCLECGKETNFNSFTIGFKKFCSSKCCNRFSAKNKTNEDWQKRNEKSKQTCLEKYGCENPFQAEEVKNKIKSKHLENLGVEYPSQSKVVQEKITQSNIESFGVKRPLQSNVILQKQKRTCIERYGVDNYSKTGVFKVFSSKRQRTENYDILCKKCLMKNIIVLDTKEEFVNNSIHKFLCQNHGEFESTATSIQKIECPECTKYGISERERQVIDFLSQYVSCEISNRKILSGKELDIYVPEKNLAVEFDGIYWHNNMFKEKNYHLQKTQECEEQGIQLVHIFESEWLNKRLIVESILLAKLGIFQKRLYARKCEVKEVSQELYREFSELNHLQGYVRAPLVLGLFFEDELVEVCSFGKSRFKSGENELLRHCSLLNTQIVGGFSKLIKAWKKLNPNEVLYTYCDRRYSTGASYLASGWEHVGTSAPNYFYITQQNLESRIKYQKHKLSEILETFDESLTEQENMSVNGFSWIYDCGNLKYKI